MILSKYNRIEEYIIQYLFIFPEWLEISKNILNKEDFKNEKFKTIFSTMVDINSADLTDVMVELSEWGFLGKIGKWIDIINFISEFKNPNRFSNYMTFLVSKRKIMEND